MGIYGEYKVECGVMSIYKFYVLPPLRDGSLEIIAEGVGTIGYLLKDPTDDGLLAFLPGHVLVKFDEAWLAAVVHDDDALDHT